MPIKVEVGKTYRNGKGHLIFIKRHVSEDLLLCVREVHGFCQLELFRSNGHPSQSPPPAKSFLITEEVTTGETVSDKDPKPFSKSPTSPGELTEVNRFVFYSAETRIRTTVFLDGLGFYHINQESKIDHLVTDRKDIHGTMNQEAYIAWLTHALLNQSYSSVKHIPEDRDWLMA